jgi:hypothetical protein
MPRSPKERLWLVAGGLVAFVMILIGYFFFIGPQRSDTDAVDQQVSEANDRNAVLQARVNSLREQNKDIAKYRAAAAQAKLALPDTNGLADFLRTLQSIGSATSTNVVSLNVGTPQPVGQVAAGSSTTSGSTASSTPAAPTAVVFGLPITAQVSGSVSEVNNFLTQLQAVQPRAVLVTEIGESSGAGSNAVVTGNATGSGQAGISLKMYAFVAPGTAAETAQLQQAAGK